MADSDEQVDLEAMKRQEYARGFNDALSQVRRMLEQMRHELQDQQDQQLSVTAQTTPQVSLSAPLKELDLRISTFRFLTLAGLRTVGSLVQMDEAKLLGIRNIGAERVQEIKRALAKVGYKLAAS